MGKFKEQNGVSRVGKFLRDVKEVLPDVGEVALKTLESGNPLSAIGHTVNKLREKADEDERVALLLQQYEMQRLEFQKEMFAISADDRKSARKDGDSSVQRVLTYIFTSGFFFSIITVVFLLYFASTKNIEIPNAYVAIITAIITTISNKLNSIIDFHFGASFQMNSKSE